MNHGSLFSGIGGFDLAAEWMGWENVFHCECNEFGQKVLSYYWPKAISYDDIKRTDFAVHRGRIDILTGGFPCQPYSQAGKRLGKEDDRHLWPEFARAIQEIQPRYIVGENVSGLLSWNGGVVFDEVQADMEAEGYEVLPFLLPAAGVNAPHRRDRIWFVAFNSISKRAGRDNPRKGKGIGMDMAQNTLERQERNQEEYKSNASATHEITTHTKSNGDRRRLRRMEEENGGNGKSKKRGKNNSESGNDGKKRDAANANSIRPPKRSKIKSNKKRLETQYDINKNNENWDNFPTQPPICSGNDGLPGGLDGIAFSKWRKESIKGYGNAIVPQVAHEIFKAIQQIEDNA